MKKLLFVLIAFASLSVQAQTVDDVIRKYADNLGGLEAFNKIKTAKITASFSSQGMDLPMTIQVVNGKAFRADVEAMGQAVIRSFKDGKAWTQNPFTGSPAPKEVTGNELNDYKSQIFIASALMDYKARGHQVELQGEADIDGIKTYKIKLTNKDDNNVTNYYVSTKDHGLVKSESERDMQGQKVNVEVFYSNLKDFNGTKFFMSRESKINGESFQTITYNNIELDVAIDDKIFEMPKS